MMRRILSKAAQRVRKRVLKPHTPATAIEVERAEQEFYLKYLRPRMVVFDVGANVGEMSLLFARLVGLRGTVHAFEASSATFAKLEQVCRLVGRTQVVLNHTAVADHEGVVDLHVYDDSHSGWNSLANRPLQNYGIDVKPTHTESIKAITIDGYCLRNGISRIDLLKIDVEGAEYQVLLGARRMLEAQSVACCVFEFGQTTFDMGNNPDEIEGYLSRCGYTIRNVVAGDSAFPGRSTVDQARFSLHVAMPMLSTS